MRIGFFAYESKNSVAVGGLAEVVTYLAQSLAELGHEVHVFTRMGRQQLEHEKIKGVYEHRCIMRSSRDVVNYMDNLCDSIIPCFDYVEEKYGRFDVLHGHDWHVVKALAKIRKKKKYKFILTYHSTEWGRSGNRHQRKSTSERIRYREQRGGKLAKMVTTVSNTMEDEIHKLYKIPHKRIRVLYNGINLSDFRGRANTNKVKAKYRIRPHERVVLFMGRMAHQKGPDILIEAVPKVVSFRKNTHFIFAGEGKKMINHINKRAKKLGVKKNVHIIGYVKEKEKLNLFKTCDILCVPSRNEPFGIITLEAWAAGKPVVAANVGGPKEIIKNFYNGIKVSQNPNSIACAINALLWDKTGKNMRQMGKNARKSALEFTWPQIARRYVKVYGELKNS